jgi:hypothetical protein
VRSLAELKHKQELRAQLAALPVTPENAKAAAGLRAQIARYEPVRDARMTLAAGGGRFALYDCYGNPIPPKDGTLTVPVDHRGFFLRGDGAPGSFAALVDAVRASRIEGLEPLEAVCRDMLAPVNKGAVLRLKLTNILNRPVTGKLALTLGKLALDAPAELSLKAHETRTLEVKVTGGEPAQDNSYPLSLVFDAGADGTAVHEETMHCNLIARRTIAVDGKLDDWQGALPQVLTAAGGNAPTLTEAAWWPFKPFDASVKNGSSVAYFAYDDRHFYLAVKAADSSPHPGTVRFATRDDDAYFYPEVCTAGKEKKPLTWPEGVRRFSYRKNMDLPFGNGKDRVQIGFNVLPAAEKPCHESVPGCPPGYTTWFDTDYEYGLHHVDPKHGGGTEIWRLASPGMPHKHFYPRSPKSPQEGAVQEAKLAVAYEGGMRVTECALPWSEIPAVKKALDAGRTIKLTYAVYDNDGPSTELARERSVSKRNPSLHPDWEAHWANEVEFAFER